MKRFKQWEYPSFDKNGWANDYGWRCFHHKNLKLGNGCDIGAFTLIQAKYGVEIGENVQIGPHSYVCSWDSERDVKGKVVIGSNSLIGAYCFILPNSVIPPNSKIRAFSIIE